MIFGLAAESALRLTGCSELFKWGTRVRTQEYLISDLTKSKLVVSKEDDEKYMVCCGFLFEHENVDDILRVTR